MKFVLASDSRGRPCTLGLATSSSDPSRGLAAFARVLLVVRVLLSSFQEASPSLLSSGATSDRSREVVAGCSAPGSGSLGEREAGVKRGSKIFFDTPENMVWAARTGLREIP